LTNEGKLLNIEEEDDNLKDDIVVPFKPKLITGGGTPPTSDNWLGKLKIGANFLCRERADKGKIDLNEYVVIATRDKAYFLALRLPRKATVDDDEVLIWVDPFRFSQGMELIDTLFEGQDE
jgi:hypothetical protein